MGRSSSGKKRAAVLGFLGFTPTTAEAEDDGQAGAGWLHHQQGRRRQCTAAVGGGGAAISKVRPSDEDGYVDGRPWWYAERDIDHRASEFIDRVHRGIALAAGDGPSV